MVKVSENCRSVQIALNLSAHFESYFHFQSQSEILRRTNGWLISASCLIFLIFEHFFIYTSYLFSGQKIFSILLESNPIEMLKFRSSVEVELRQILAELRPGFRRYFHIVPCFEVYTCRRAPWCKISRILNCLNLEGITSVGKAPA